MQMMFMWLELEEKEKEKASKVSWVVATCSVATAVERLERKMTATINKIVLPHKSGIKS